jgi:hypothetical protein
MRQAASSRRNLTSPEGLRGPLLQRWSGVNARGQAEGGGEGNFTLAEVRRELSLILGHEC